MITALHVLKRLPCINIVIIIIIIVDFFVLYCFIAIMKYWPLQLRTIVNHMNNFSAAISPGDLEVVFECIRYVLIMICYVGTYQELIIQGGQQTLKTLETLEDPEKPWIFFTPGKIPWKTLKL